MAYSSKTYNASASLVQLGEWSVHMRARIEKRMNIHDHLLFAMTGIKNRILHHDNSENTSQIIKNIKQERNRNHKTLQARERPHLHGKLPCIAANVISMWSSMPRNCKLMSTTKAKKQANNTHLLLFAMTHGIKTRISYSHAKLRQSK